MILSYERFQKGVEENGKKNIQRRMPIDEAKKFIEECTIAGSLFRRRKPGHKRPKAGFQAGQDEILSG